MSYDGGDRIKETSATSGTSDFVLSGAVSGEGVRALGSGDDGKVFRYFAKHTTADEAEVGIGTYTHATRTLTRDYIYYPTRGGLPVTFSAGGLHVGITPTAADVLPFIETRDPTAEDGIAEGFLRGMDWLNTATGAVWRCVDHGTGGSPGDAVWKRLDGAGGGPAQETAVFADDGATITAATHGKYAGDTIRKVILRNDDDQSDTVTVTLENDLAMRVEFLVADDQMGDCTIEVASGDIINGTTDGSVTLKGAGRSGTVIPIGSGEYRFEGETSETLVVDGPVDFNGQVVSGNLAGTTAASMNLTDADSGKILITSGNVTIPTTAGFNITLVAGGAHSVGNGSVTSGLMSAGDVMTVFNDANGDIHGMLVDSASKVEFSS